MSRIYHKPKVGDVVIWLPRKGSTPLRYFADTVMLISEEREGGQDGYLRRVYLRGGCMIDQRSIVAVLPAGSVVKHDTVDEPGVAGYRRIF